ncbi:hypothetical protein CCACVL1_13907 [Corchorus capsularis]|uniref:Uncharacterized protein n=1 Tax=Corchorus capsularis TaxID=210143 RepID=A0A1R3I946_COCAP|nr:hypothetical protein CCACVL1_13907 [Corchorus capsularis]
MGRPPCCDKSNVKRGLWTAEEDARILAYVSNHGIGNWTLVPKKAGLNRCGKSCRLRWTNYLRPDLKHESFTPQEEQVIINLHELIGSRWSLIAKHLPGRTDNDVKNYWNTKLRKKLSKMGIDPITHKPISQVLSDYGNINNLPRTENFSNSFGKNFRNKSIPNRNIQNNCMVQKPMMEQVQDTNKHVPWDISSQFQAVISIQPNMLSTDQVTSSCSSSSASTTAFKASSESQITPTSSSPFSWSEFLLTDPLLHETSPSHQGQEQKFPPMSSPRTSSTMKHKEESHCRANGEVEAFGAYDDSSASSFVDAILVRDSEIRSQFPEFLHVSFDD